MSWTKVVAITGCDSGLGWALAARIAKEGIVTVAGMYQGSDTEAAKALQQYCIHPCKLDVTQPESVASFREYIVKLLRDNPHYRLYAVVNNAGTMAVGDYEWQTPNMIENTINVNLLGAMRITTAFLPFIRATALEGRMRPRVINVTSHCGLYPLPGFAAYSASKAGLYAFTEALRLEQIKHGLYAVSFVPGGFVGSSNIMREHPSNTEMMLKELNEEQKAFYEKRILSLAAYLQPAAQVANYDALKNENIIEFFMKALNDKRPKDLYKVESLRYKIYYGLLELPLPEFLRRWIIKRFINFPDK